MSYYTLLNSWTEIDLFTEVNLKLMKMFCEIVQEQQIFESKFFLCQFVGFEC